MKKVWTVPVLCIGLIACGGVDEAGQLGASLEEGTLDEKSGGPGDDKGAGDPNDPGDKDPSDKDPGDHEDPGGDCGDTGPPALCSDKGLACSVIADKENLCPEGSEPIWELACGDNEVCCAPLGTTAPGDPNEPGKGDPTDPGTGK